MVEVWGSRKKSDGLEGVCPGVRRQRGTVGQDFGELCEVANPCPELGIIAVEVAGKAVRNLICRIGITHDHILEGEVGIVEGVDKFTHVFHALPHGCPVFCEAFGSQVAVEKATVNGLAGEHSAFKRKHDPTAEDGV